jgi:hypothetical protein
VVTLPLATLRLGEGRGRVTQGDQAPGGKARTLAVLFLSGAFVLAGVTAMARSRRPASPQQDQPTLANEVPQISVLQEEVALIQIQKRRLQ